MPPVPLIRLVAFDLAGTTIDFGSRAPDGVFVDLFTRHVVNLSEAEARGPMGTAKRDHIAALAALPRVAATTGYDTAMTEVVMAAARRQGFDPEAVVCASDVAAGRPAPWMIFRAMEETGVWPAAAGVAVGDTLADISAARNAGVWAVGVTATGNMLGLSRAAHDALSPADRTARLAEARRAMLAAGAHAVVESVAELPVCLKTLAGSPENQGPLPDSRRPAESPHFH